MSYEPAEIEAKHYARWERAGYFAPSGRGEPYCIVIPPPNVTGTLHMGHAFQDTIMDALARYHRMRGFNTLWQPGTDHAGIATQMVVERLLNSEGTSRTELGREKFVERVWAWKEQSGNTISSQMRRLAASVDWSRDCFTMDPRLSDAVTEVFVRLHDKGLIYRGKRLVNWDPVLHTALSDLEVLGEEEQGKLWRFRYPIEGSDDHVVVATTRPETMLGDTAVAVHPDDARYAHLHGRHVRLPIADRRIPVVVDDYVDPEFGTGCVKITPAHDFNDYEVGQRHDLPVINVFDESAALNDNAPAAYRGLDRFEARARVVADLEALGLVDKIEDHTAVIPRGDRSGAVIEPLLTDQWYVRAEPLAEPAIAAVEDGRTRFVPENWAKTYFEWMRNIQDWCISRQLWWGHRIPAWYDGAGNVYVGRDEAEVRSKHGLGPGVTLAQDEDVLDTWFSSALWPFTTLGWPERMKALETFYPTTVLVTGFDIIFFWVARMLMMGLEFAGDVPFREVYVTPLVRDHEGRKMSKSKGNTLDPIDFVDGIDIDGLVAKRTEGLMQPHLKQQIEAVTRREFPDGIPAFGADAVRLTFASLATMGRDVRFELGRVDGYHRFCNKLWNATAFVLGQLDPADTGSARPSTADRWIRSRLGATIDAVHSSFAGYRFDHAVQALYEFTWHEFCDWYLEFTKPVLNDERADPDVKRAVRATLTEVLGALLKLLHPVVPFVTEELWLELAAKARIDSETVVLEPMPAGGDFPEDREAEAEIEWIKDLIVGVRQIRGEMNLSASKPLPVKLAGGTADDVARVERNDVLIRQLARIESIDWLDADAFVAGAATALLRDVRILVPLAGLIDIDAERQRLTKQLERVEADRANGEKKLANPKFVSKAPEDVVAKERARVADLVDRATRLREQLERLAEIQ